MAKSPLTAMRLPLQAVTRSVLAADQLIFPRQPAGIATATAVVDIGHEIDADAEAIGETVRAGPRAGAGAAVIVRADLGAAVAASAAIAMVGRHVSAEAAAVGLPNRAACGRHAGIGAEEAL